MSDHLLSAKKLHIKFPNGAASITVKVNNVAKFAVFGVDQAASPLAPKPTVNLSDLAAH